MERLQIAFVAEQGVNLTHITTLKKKLISKGASVKILSSNLKTLGEQKGEIIKSEKTFSTMPAVLFDAAYIPGGNESHAALQANPEAREFIQTIFNH